MSVVTSVVSHGHGEMVWRLVDQLVACPEVAQIIVTLNIPEVVPDVLDRKVLLLRNELPKGFGANHNAAFTLAKSDFYCVINPDIELIEDPFAALLVAMNDKGAGISAPLVVASDGALEDSMRSFLTPWAMVKRVFGFSSGAYLLRRGDSDFAPDWVAGMFMLFKSEAYAKVGGYDERYFMYCEDADICTRLWKAGYKVVGCLSAGVIHNAQRASHRSFRHLSWHVRSLARYFWSHSFSLPSKQIA